MPCFRNSVDPDQLASEEANWSGSALFAINNVNWYQQSGSSNLIGWKLEVGVAIYSAGQGLICKIFVQLWTDIAADMSGCPHNSFITPQKCMLLASASN